MRWQLAAAGIVALWLLSGCAGGGGASSAPATAASVPSSQAAQPTPPQTAAPAPGADSPAAHPTVDHGTMERVVREWSQRLDAGDNAGAARLFALPALIAQGGGIGRFETYKELAAWHAGLPCSGTVETITFETNAAVAVFVLGDRSTSKCDAAPGTKAAARFYFRGQKIFAWEQISVPGEGGGGASTNPVA